MSSDCDVVILGSGLAGSVCGAILARQGARVVLVDAGQHPRFAIGESMIPQLVEWLHILKSRFDVPELGYLLDLKSVRKNLGTQHGTKQNFGFVRHAECAEPRPEEAAMLAIPRVLTEASHLYRQDTDQFFFNVAARYGCVTRQHWRATVTGTDGEVFRARYLIDASGFRSPVADKLGLREQPPRFKHHSRSLFTHYIGVRPFDDVAGWPRGGRPPAPWHSGTLHHLIDRGWFWIIPFDNHKGSTNPLCSVGLTIDERTYPRRDDVTAEEEFQGFLDRYPAVKRQFAGAARVREWVSTPRLQYSARRTVGPRWCMMSHAAGFIDPLYSRGLTNTFEVIYSLCTRLLQSLSDDNWSTGRYDYLEELQHGLLKYNDDMVNSSFIAFSHFRLFNAVFRVWCGFLTPGVLRLLRARTDYELTGDEGHLRKLEESRYPGLWWPERDFRQLLDLTAETCEKYEAGQLTGDQAADAVFAAIRQCDSVNPVFGWQDEDHRYVRPSTAQIARFMHWGTRRAPDGELRETCQAVLAGSVRSALKGKKPL
jgi:FADH2 O2-dependent halogenase